MRVKIFSLLFVLIAGAAGNLSAQTPKADGVGSAVKSLPALSRQQGQLPELAGATRLLHFALYTGTKTEPSGEPLWQEEQTVEIAVDGQFTVYLGAGSKAGLPATVFLDGQPRWLTVSEDGRELSRTLLGSVPYALKATDANSLGGEPAASFVTQKQLAGVLDSLGGSPRANESVDNSAATPAGAVIALSNSALFQTGSGSSAKVGLGTTSPATPLDVNGTATFRGNLVIPSLGATSTQGKSSPYLSMFGSSYSSSLAKSISQNFSWRVAPTGNNTATPSANLELLFGAGNQAPTTTGLSIAPNGVITFAAGQTFPGGGAGAPTITGTTIGNKSPVGTITGVTAGTGLTGGGTSGNVTLNLDSSKVPLLAAGRNIFTGAEVFTGTVDFSSPTLIAVNTVARGPVYPLDVEGGPASQPMVGIVTKGTDAALTLKNTGSGGREYWLDSGSTGAGVGAGNFSIWDAKAGARLTIDAAGEVGIGTQTPSGNQLAVVASGSDAGMSATAGTGWAGNFTNNSTYQATVNATNKGNGNAGYFANNNASRVALAGVNASADPAAAGTYGSTSNGYGVYGTSGGSAGVYGINSGSGVGVLGKSQAAWGVYGVTQEGYGVWGQWGFQSDQSSHAGFKGAIWGDAGDSSTPAKGIVGTADDQGAGLFLNNSSRWYTLAAYNASGAPNFNGSSAKAFAAGGPDGVCGVEVNGDLGCTGRVKAVVTTRNARQVETYSVQSAENWLEDYGAGVLSSGTAAVRIDPAFADAVNTGVDYHVFLTPKGDCKGLYVDHETAEGFEVHELGGGKSAIGFDYKIVAKRTGHEAERLIDVTEVMESERKALANEVDGGKRTPAPRTAPGSSPLLSRQ